MPHFWQDTSNTLQTQEDKANHLSKVKIKLEGSLQEVWQLYMANEKIYIYMCSDARWLV